MRGDAELGVGRAISAIIPAPLDDLEEKTLAVIAAIKLEVLSVVVAVVQDAELAKSLQECLLQSETGIEIVIIVCYLAR